MHLYFGLLFQPSSSAQHTLPGPSFQNNAGFVPFQNQGQGNGVWPCLIDDPSKVRFTFPMSLPI